MRNYLDQPTDFGPIPLVSVVVPTYKRDELLCQTLSCLLQQDYASYEIIVVDQTRHHDQATTDFLTKINGRIRYFVLSKPNVSSARNFGIDQGRGDIFIFFDDDLKMSADVISKVVATLRDKSIAGLVGQVIEDDRPLEDVLRSEVLPVRVFGGAFMCFRREVFNKVGGFDEWFAAQMIPAGEDTDFACRAVNSGFKIVLDKSIAVYHCGKMAPGGCERHVLKHDQFTSDADVFAFLAVLWKNRKPGIRHSVAALWRGYHAHVLNLELVRHLFKGTIYKHVRFFRLFRQVLREPWLSNAK